MGLWAGCYGKSLHTNHAPPFAAIIHSLTLGHNIWIWPGVAAGGGSHAWARLPWPLLLQPLVRGQIKVDKVVPNILCVSRAFQRYMISLCSLYDSPSGLHLTQGPSSLRSSRCSCVFRLRSFGGLPFWRENSVLTPSVSLRVSVTRENIFSWLCRAQSWAPVTLDGVCGSFDKDTIFLSTCKSVSSTISGCSSDFPVLGDTVVAEIRFWPPTRFCKWKNDM